MMSRQQHVVAFYARHPISAEHILKTLAARRGGVEGLKPEELWPFDQDHYGGLAANDMLAERAGLRPGLKVADFCAGLGGPARYFAQRFGVDVTGVELTEHRVRGADELTRAVGMQDRVRVLHGDVTSAPLADATMDVVVSQEAFLHVPDKGQVLTEVARVLRPGGRLVFTDWVEHRPLSSQDAEAMWIGIAAQTLQTVEGYRRLLSAAGLATLRVDDLTGEWGAILEERRRMYGALRDRAVEAGTPAGDDAFYLAYVRLVELVQARELGGARFTAEKPRA